jgi:hypothetical protein
MDFDKKSTALDLIDQIIILEKDKESYHLRLLAEKKIYPKGENSVIFHLKSLKELVSAL